MTKRSGGSGSTSGRGAGSGGGRNSTTGRSGTPAGAGPPRVVVGPSKDSDRRWQAKSAGAERAASLHATQSDAIARAHELLERRGGGELTVQRPDGRIRDSDTVAPGSDPSPPKDTK